MRRRADRDLVDRFLFLYRLQGNLGLVLGGEYSTFLWHVGFPFLFRLFITDPLSSFPSPLHCPDIPQWGERMKLKRPGIHQLEMLQALGHGSEGNLYFQWR